GARMGRDSSERGRRYQGRRARRDRLRDLIEQRRVDTAHPYFAARSLEFRVRPSFVSILRRPEIHMEDLIREGVLTTEPVRREDIVSLETSIKYEVYLKQQERESENLKKAECRRIPGDFDYAGMERLS